MGMRPDVLRQVGQRRPLLDQNCRGRTGVDLDLAQAAGCKVPVTSGPVRTPGACPVGHFMRGARGARGFPRSAGTVIRGGCQHEPR